MTRSPRRSARASRASSVQTFPSTALRSTRSRRAAASTCSPSSTASSRLRAHSSSAAGRSCTRSTRSSRSPARTSSTSSSTPTATWSSATSAIARPAAGSRRCSRRRRTSPFAYAEEGFPDLLEIPFQFWLDGVWFDAHGYGEGRAFRDALRGAIDEVVEQDLVFATAFHEWCAIAADEDGTGWIRGLLEYAR